MDIQKLKPYAEELPNNLFVKPRKSGSGCLQLSSYHRAHDVAFKTTGKKQFKTVGEQAPRIISKSVAQHQTAVPNLTLARTTIEGNSRESLQIEFPEENSDLLVRGEDNQLRLRGTSH